MQFAVVPQAHDTTLTREAASTALAFAHAGVWSVSSPMSGRKISWPGRFSGAGMRACAVPQAGRPDILLYHSTRPRMERARLH
ncbi:hypothetical protein RAA17_04325 [Komagataeibacter rhaeticus]|nr:hypothetical protein [Komagataeibacter rhaeticus]